MMNLSRGWGAGVLAAGLMACAGWATMGPRGAAAQPEQATNPSPVPQVASPADVQFAQSLSRAFQQAAARVEPSVVNITTRSERVARDFFGRRFRQEASGLGSGVVITDDGYILTNNHVVEDATELAVKLYDGRTVDAEVVGTDPIRDLAVVKVKTTGLTPARFGDSDGLEVGQWVLAVGSPFGFDQSVTAGIVSAKGRGLGIVSDEFKDAEDFIQTDAAINPGNSGGPLINLDGQVVGINSAIFTRTGGSVGLGFSIPARLAQAVYENIVHGGRADFGWLGVEFEAKEGAKIARVLDSSPAASAGLRVGDKIVKYQGKPVIDVDQLIRSIQFTPPGSEAALEVARDGHEVEVRAKVSSRTDAEVAQFGGKEIPDIGLTVVTATEKALGTGEGTDPLGAYVVDVEPGSVAAAAGLLRGDLILGADGTAVSDADALVGVLSRTRTRVRIDLQRGQMRGYTTLGR
ncbi:MAG: trypsin-like peptidase domain-containing protein [Phycisphaerales bacterium]|nr:trypsin-like peptidase domain-containing protein [Phycisphaerales bacterium]